MMSFVCVASLMEEGSFKKIKYESLISKKNCVANHPPGLLLHLRTFLKKKKRSIKSGKSKIHVEHGNTSGGFPSVKAFHPRKSVLSTVFLVCFLESGVPLMGKGTIFCRGFP